MPNIERTVAVSLPVLGRILGKSDCCLSLRGDHWQGGIGRMWRVTSLTALALVASVFLWGTTRAILRALLNARDIWQSRVETRHHAEVHDMAIDDTSGQGRYWMTKYLMACEAEDYYTSVAADRLVFAIIAIVALIVLGVE